MVFKIRVGRWGFFYLFFFYTYKYAPSSKITQTCFVSFLLQLINPNIDQMYKEMKKIQTGNWSNKSVSIKRLSESVNIATFKRLLLKSETNMETETNFWILPIYYFFGINKLGSAVKF